MFTVSSFVRSLMKELFPAPVTPMTAMKAHGAPLTHLIESIIAVAFVQLELQKGGSWRFSVSIGASIKNWRLTYIPQ